MFSLEAKMLQKRFVVASWVVMFVLLFLLSQVALVAFAAKSELEGAQRMLDTGESIHASDVAQLLSVLIPQNDHSTIRLPLVLKSNSDTSVKFRDRLFKNISNEFIVTYTNDQVLVKRRG